MTYNSIDYPVTTIDKWAVKNYGGEIEIPASVKEVKELAFSFFDSQDNYGYDRDGTVTCRSEVPPVIPFSYCSFGWPERYLDGNGTRATMVLYVPKGTKEAYKAASGWENFETIIELEATDIEKIMQE